MTFKPAVNAKGLSLLTFTGFETKTGRSIKTIEVSIMDGNKPVKHHLPQCDDNGEMIYREWTINQLTFSAKGTLIGTESKVSIMTEAIEDISPDSKLFTVLTFLGFDFSDYQKEVVDDDGDIQILFGSSDDDGDISIDALVAEIKTFIQSIVGQKFRARLIKGNKGFYSVDFDTLVKV